MSAGATLRRLVDRVCAGEVVFFIGAGFSLDAEGNSARVLLARLLMRFEALSWVLMQDRDPERVQKVQALRRGLRATFGFLESQPAGTAAPVLDELFDDGIDHRLTSLAQSYFQVNDWLCAAFDELVLLLVQRLGQQPGPRRQALAQAVHGCELQLCAALGRQQNWPQPPRPAPLDVELMVRFWKHCARVTPTRTERALAGKLLFLDSMGFAESAVMCGSPMARDIDLVRAGAAALLPRHHVLAWLAAEGLCPSLVTTNFDLLLESAYRLAGLLPWNAPASAWPDDLPQLQGGVELHVPQNRRYSHFARIANAAQFFSHAQAARAVHLYKIHGCADAYRIARQEACTLGHGDSGLALLRALLPSIVFTFREIQNWRDDTWSRDHLNTLLRTKTIVFSGYSGADPVIHDTFRTIYEEMAGYRRTGRGLESALPGASNDTRREVRAAEAAPAFFIGSGREFHGLEILRAASMAAGEPRPDVTDHANLVPFHRGKEGLVPTLDEVYTLLYHQCMRRQQRQALEAQLPHAYYQLSGKRSPAADAEMILQHFDALCGHEHREADALLGGGAADAAGDAAAAAAQRRRLASLAGWTWHFHRSLLREYALAESFLRHPAAALTLQRTAALPWYCPAGEHADWSAWGVVIEIALRRAVGRCALGSGGPVPAAWMGSTHLTAAPHSEIALALRLGPVPRALMIGLAPMRRMFMRRPPRALRALPELVWDIGSETVPWWRDDDRRRPAATPSAAALWQWAAWPASSWTIQPDSYLACDAQRSVA